MYRKFHDRFGSAGVVISVIALIAALGGTAIAAAGLTAQQEKQVKKIAKKYAGKPGPPGATGPVGTAGANGKDGTNGTNGKNGTDGESVAISAYKGEECEEGEGEEGAKFTNAKGTAYACNGKEGSPWTVGGVLPTGKTLKGMWGAGAGETQTMNMPISFNIPLNGPLAAGNVHFAGNATGTGELTSGSPTVTNFVLADGTEFVAAGEQISGTGIPAGTTITSANSVNLTLSANAEATAAGVTLTVTPPASCDNGSGPPPTVVNPEADPGNLCVFVQKALGIDRSFIKPSITDASNASGASPFGAIVFAFANSAVTEMKGSWAVTAGA